MDYQKTNKESWNKRTEQHVKSDFYDVAGFLNGKSSLDEISLDLIGDIKGKSILHLQCHFGLDSLSLARMGAQVTAMDFSDVAINQARLLAEKSQLGTTFICCDLYDLPNQLDQKFDIVYTSFGVIGWLPDLDKWANVIQHFLKPNGRFIFAEFHPVVWMFDDDFSKITYRYFQSAPIIEEEGTYTDTKTPVKTTNISWNHGLGEVVSALIKNGIDIQALTEYDYSPFDCFNHTKEFAPKRFRIKKMGDMIPMVYAIIGIKKGHLK